MRESKYREIGINLKRIRERLNWTLSIMSSHTGISPSYLSDFERGFKLPTSKYLKYLYHIHNIDLNYVFGGTGRMLREEIGKGVKPDFGKYTEEIDELLYFLSRVPHALYAVLGYFTEYKLKNKQLLNEFLTKKEDKENKEKMPPPGNFNEMR